MTATATEAAPRDRSNEPLIGLRSLTKRFPGVLALDGVTFDICAGEIHALVGENGAGKSTLIKILSGVYGPDGGEVTLAGEQVHIHTPYQAQRLGITTIHQEFSLAPDLTGIQNIFLGRELRKRVLGRRIPLLDDRGMAARVRELCSDFRLDPGELHLPVSQLGALKQHVTEILKALAFEARLVIMDEPTAALTNNEREALFDHMRTLRAGGITVLWVTHRLEELVGLADRATVLRDGRFVGTVDPAEAGIGGLVKMMVGREVRSLAEIAGDEVAARAADADVALEVEGLTRGSVVVDATFTLRRGEIVGIAGLAGAGRTELARLILGADPAEAGEIRVDGKPVRVASPREAYAHGIALVPEERKVQGIFGEFSVAKNISAAALHRVLHARFVIDRRREDRAAAGYVQELGIKTPGTNQKISFLSGGNQQKAIIARCLFAQPKVVIFDEPTQGIDVGAKSEVYRLINHYVLSGGAVVVISSELPELLGLCDRILVMRNGRIAGEVAGDRSGGTDIAGESRREEHIMLLATRGRLDDAA